MKKKTHSHERRIQTMLILFMIGLTLSGLLAIPTSWEAAILKQWLGSDSWFGNLFPVMSIWFDKIYNGVQNGYGSYPFLAYGTDWLAFGHIAIAVAFIGPLRDSIRNIWVVEFGMIAYALIIPWAITFSLVRGIPLFWTLIDMSFGVIGFIPLWIVRRDILAMSENK